MVRIAPTSILYINICISYDYIYNIYIYYLYMIVEVEHGGNICSAARRIALRKSVDLSKASMRSSPAVPGGRGVVDHAQFRGLEDNFP